MTTAAATKDVKINQTILRIQQGDLTALPVDAIVFYAREDLALGSGFGTAIQVRGGDTVKKELEKTGSISMGQAAMTTAGNLPASHIIHACGPKFQEPDTERKLRQCVLSAMNVAGQNGVKSVAFPPMGAGFYGVPLELCATVMLEAIHKSLEGGTPLERVIICVLDRREFTVFQAKLEELERRGL